MFKFGLFPGNCGPPWHPLCGSIEVTFFFLDDSIRTILYIKQGFKEVLGCISYNHIFKLPTIGKKKKKSSGAEVKLLSYVQTDTTTPNIVGPHCWELLRPFARG